MSKVEVGKIYEGKVTGITKFGAFVSIEGTTGMVHISEIANTYVSEIKDHVTEGQTVRVKVLSVAEDGKISLSMKKAEDNAAKPQQKKPGAQKPQQPRQRPPQRPVYNGSDAPADWEQPKKATTESFEDMLSSFKQKSEEKIGDLKRITENKRRSPSRKK